MVHQQQRAQHNPSTPATAVASRNAESATSNSAAQPAQGGIRGWLSGAGRWMGERYQDAKEAVGAGLQAAKKTATDIVELASSTDVNFGKGGVSVTTDADELMDLMPASVRQMVQLDRQGAENKVSLRYDRAAGKVVASTPAMAISAIQSARLQTGPVMLKDVTITLANPGGGIPGLSAGQGVLGWRDKDDNLGGTLRAGSVVAENVVVQRASGPMAVGKVEVAGFSAQASARGGSPFGEKGATEASFGLESAILSKVSGPEGTAETVRAGASAGGMSGSAETAFLETSGLQISGARKGGVAIGDASVGAARVDVLNRGGGLVGLDGKKDHMDASIRVSTAQVQDFAQAGSTLKSGQASNIAGRYHQDSGQGSLSAASAQLGGLSAGGLQAQRLKGQGLSATGGGAAQQFTAQEIDGQGISGGGASLAGGALTELNLARGAQGLSGRAGSLELQGLSHGASGVSLERGLATSLSLGQGAQGLQGEVGRFTGSGLRAGEAARLGQVDLQGIAARQRQDGASVSLAGAQLGGVEFQGAGQRGGAERLGLSGTQVDVGQGGVQATTRSAEAQGLALGDSVSADRLSLSEGRMGMDGRQTTMGASAVGLTGLRSADLKVGSSEAQGVEVLLDKEGGRTNVAQAQARDIAVADRTSVNSASLQGLQSHLGPGRRTTTIQSAALQGITDRPTAARVQQAELKDLDLSQGQGSAGLRVGGASATGLAMGDLSASRASLSGLRYAQQPGLSSSLQLSDAAAQGIRKGRELAVDHARAQGLQAELGSTSRASFDALDVAGARLQHEGLHASLDSATARGARMQSGPQGSALDLHSLDLQRLKASATPSAGSGGGPGVVDSAALLRSAAARVDDADLRLSAPLAAGDLGPARVRPGTRVDGQLTVRDNEISTRGTAASFSRPLDGPLWTKVKGAYVDDQGRLKADVQGWGDQDLTSTVNNAVGAQGPSLPSVAEIGAGLSRSRGGSGGGRSAAVVDPRQVQASGQVSFSPGQLDAGQVARMELARGEAGENTAAVSADGKGGFAARLKALVLGRWSSQSAAGNASGAGGRVEGLSVGQSAEGRTEAELERARLRELKLRR